jgi:hypothetical protein
MVSKNFILHPGEYSGTELVGDRPALNRFRFKFQDQDGFSILYFICGIMDTGSGTNPVKRFHEQEGICVGHYRTFC